MDERPAIIAAFADEPRWVAWRYENVGDRRTKVPYSTAGKRASTKKPDDWSTLEEAAGVHPSNGVGIVLGEGLHGVDLDACLRQGVLEPWAAEIVQRLATYTEVSPSGGGVKAFFVGPEGASCAVSFGEPVHLDNGESKRKEIAYFTGGRYFTVTRNVFLDAPLASISLETDAWLRANIAKRRASTKAGRERPAASLRPSPNTPDLPIELRTLIECGADPGADRSGQFHRVVCWLADRDHTEAQIAALLERFPEGIAAKYAGRISDEVTRCLTKRVLPSAVDSADSVDSVDSDPALGEWGDLLVPSTSNLPALPCRLLPGIAGAMAAAITEANQTPSDIAVMTMLPAFATAVQKRFEAQPTSSPDYVEPLAMWCLVASASGTRKTAVLNAVLRPVHDWEERERKRLAPEIAGRFAARAVAEKRIDKLKEIAAKAEVPQDRQRAEQAIQAEKEHMPGDLFAPILVVGDTTPEAAQRLLVQNGETLSIVSDEGGIIDIMSGAYGDRSVLDVFLKGHSASPVHVERQTRSAHLLRPCLSMGLAVQPGVIEALGDNKRLRDSGAVARFLYALPATTVGQRDVRRQIGIPGDIRKSYNDRLQELLDAGRQEGVVTLTFAAEATEEYFQFAEQVERLIGAHGRLEALADWGSKLPGAMVRVAAIMALMDGGAATTTVEEAHALQARELCSMLIEHALAAFRLMGADGVEADAWVLIKWIVAERHPSFKRSTAQKALHGRFHTVERLKVACERLYEWNAVSAEFMHKNPGARATPYYKVNPAVHAPGVFDFSRNSP